MTDLSSESWRVLLQWLEFNQDELSSSLDDLDSLIADQIAEIDRKSTELVRVVIQHPKFKRLEASYLGIWHLLCSAIEGSALLKEISSEREISVHVLDVSSQEIIDDLLLSLYDSTNLYKKLFDDRYDRLVARNELPIENYSAIYPFSLILVDFEFSYPSARKPNQISLGVLQKFAQIGEACFCMFLTGVAPQFFGDNINSFRDFDQIEDWEQLFSVPRFQREWADFRSSESSRMIGLAMPRVLRRLPYRKFPMGSSGFLFDEFDGHVESEKWCWGNGAFAVIQPYLRSYLQYGWFAHVSGVDRDSMRFLDSIEDPEKSYCAGLIEGTPHCTFNTDALGAASFPPVEFQFSEKEEALLAKEGFISLFAINQSSKIATLSSQSVQAPKRMTSNQASNNFRLSTMFNYMLCVCRVAHLLMMQCRSKIGSLEGAENLEHDIHGWLMDRSCGQNRPDIEKMRKPFLDDETSFEVTEDVLVPGRFNCLVSICPHHKFDGGNTKLIFEPITFEMQVNMESN